MRIVQAIRRLLKSGGAKPYRALAYFPNQIRGSVLDAGCGSGRNLKFASRFTRRVVGVDANENHIRSLRLEGFNAALLDLDVFPYPFRDGEFDAVLCIHVLEHLSSPLKALAELHRITKEGGSLIVAVPNPNCVYFNFYQPRWSDHLHKWTKTQMAHALASSGFQVERTVTNPPFSSNPLWLRAFNKLPVHPVWGDFCFLCKKTLQPP